MIDINLVPANLRKKENRGSGFLKSIDLPKEILFGLGSLFILVVMVIHVGLLSNYLAKVTELSSLKGQWQKMLPDKKSMDAINEDLKEVKNQLTVIKDVNSQKAVVWSQKLNILSDMMPKGMWFNRLVWDSSKGMLFIEGSSYSKAHDEISIVGGFVSALKKDENFAKDFASIELNSVNRIKKGSTEVADYKITVKSK
jgi:hypothetical protein